LLRQWIVHAPSQSQLHGLERRSQPLLGRVPQHQKLSLVSSPTLVGEAEEGESLRLPCPASLPGLGGEPAELDEPRLFGMQFQVESPESIPKIRMKPYGIGLVLEANNEVISIPDDDHVAPSMSLPPLIGPQVEDVVQVDIRQEG
jgi:hypothetical protein